MWNCSWEPSCFQASFASTLSPGLWLSALPSQPQLSRHQLTFCQRPTTDTNSIQMNLILLKKMMHIIRSFLIAPNVSLRTQGWGLGPSFFFPSKFNNTNDLGRSQFVQLTGLLMNLQHNVSRRVSESGVSLSPFKEVQDLEILAYQKLSIGRHLHY